MTKKYEVELFEGSWSYAIGKYNSFEEAEEEYESRISRKELYEERKSRLYDSTAGWYYEPWTRHGAYRIQQTESISVYLNEVTYDEDSKPINNENGEPETTIKSTYYSGSDFLEDYRKENESDDED